MKKILFLLFSLLLIIFSSCKKDGNPTSPTTFPTQGLIAYYPFNGNANDESENGNNGIIDGATLTTDRFGETNKAYYFNGNSLIYSPSSISINSIQNQLTISAWVNIDNKVTTDVQNIVGKWVTGQGFVFEINYPQSGKNSPKFVIQVPTQYYINSQTELNLNSWYHLLAIYDSSKIKIYINDTLNISLAATGNITMGNADLRIGGSTDPTDRNYFYGKIDDVRIYNRVLNDTEIYILYHEKGW